MESIRDNAGRSRCGACVRTISDCPISFNPLPEHVAADRLETGGYRPTFGTNERQSAVSTSSFVSIRGIRGLEVLQRW